MKIRLCVGLRMDCVSLFEKRTLKTKNPTQTGIHCSIPVRHEVCMYVCMYKQRWFSNNVESTMSAPAADEAAYLELIKSYGFAENGEKKKH